MAKVTKPWSTHQQRQLSYIAEFTTYIQHVAGKNYLVADWNAQVIAGAVHLVIDYACMVVDQAADPDVQAFRMAVTGLQLKDIAFDGANTTLLYDVSTCQPQS